MKKAIFIIFLIIVNALLSAAAPDVLNGGLPIGLSNLETAVLMHPDQSVYILADESDQRLEVYISVDNGSSFNPVALDFGPYDILGIKNLKGDPDSSRLFFLGSDAYETSLFSLSYRDSEFEVAKHSDPGQDILDYAFLGEDDDSFCLIYTTVESTYSLFLSQSGISSPSILEDYPLSLENLLLRQSRIDDDIVYSGLIPSGVDPEVIDFTEISLINGVSKQSVPVSYYKNNNHATARIAGMLKSVYMDDYGIVKLHSHDSGIEYSLSLPESATLADVEKVFFTPLETGVLINLFAIDENSHVNFFTYISDWDGNLSEVNAGQPMNRHPILPQHIGISDYGFPFYISTDGIEYMVEVFLYDSELNNHMLLQNNFDFLPDKVGLFFPDNGIVLNIRKGDSVEIQAFNGMVFESTISFDIDVDFNNSNGLTADGSIYSIDFAETYMPPAFDVDSVKSFASNNLLVKSGDEIYMLKTGDSE